MLYVDLLLAIFLTLLVWRLPLIGWFRDRVACLIPEAAATPAAALLVLSFAFEVWLLWGQAVTGRGAQLPLPAVDDGAFLSPSLERFSTAFFLVAASQTLLLLVVYLSLRERQLRGRTRVFLWLSAIVTALTAAVAPLLTSADAYSYVGYALPGVNAYAPPSIPFFGEFSAINRWWGTPLVAAPYGPVFLAYDRALTAFVPGLVPKIEILRIANVGWLGVLVYALLRNGIDWRVTLLAALNPFVALAFIVNPHNDLAAVTLCVLAISAARRFPAISALLLVISGLWKLPFAIVGLCAFWSSRARFAWCGATLAITIILSAAFGGTPYLTALFAHVHERSNFIGAYHAGAAIAAIASIFALIAFKKRFAFAPYLMPALAGGLFPWYALWGLPFAALSRNQLACFLIVLPLFGFTMESVADTAPALLGIFIILVSACLVALFSLISLKLRNPVRAKAPAK